MDSRYAPAGSVDGVSAMAFAVKDTPRRWQYVLLLGWCLVGLPFAEACVGLDFVANLLLTCLAVCLVLHRDVRRVELQPSGLVLVHWLGSRQHLPFDLLASVTAERNAAVVQTTLVH